MLLYKKGYKLNLDYFNRVQVSGLLKYIISEINDIDFPCHTTYGNNIILHTNSKNSFNKSELIVELIVYDELDRSLYTNYINPYKHTFRKRIYLDNTYTKHRGFRATVKYKSMNLPLGKLRVKHYRGAR